jgi:hypothetical protein
MNLKIGGDFMKLINDIKIKNVMIGFEKWMVRVLDKKTPWTESQIRSFRKYIGSCGVEFTSLKEILIDTLDFNYDITKEQTKKGLNYLFKIAFKKDGSLRETKVYPFGVREVEVLRNFSHFKFVGIERQNWNSYFDEYQASSPVYRVVSKNGTSFEYVAGSFGSIEVVG